MNRSISAATETIVYMDGLTAEQKSVLIRLLPYVHSHSNLICEDPFELDPTKVRFLNASQIAEKGGISRQKVAEVIKALDKAGAIAQVQRKLFKQLGGDKREALVILNPYIFYRKQGKPDALLMQNLRQKLRLLQRATRIHDYTQRLHEFDEAQLVNETIETSYASEESHQQNSISHSDDGDTARSTMIDLEDVTRVTITQRR